MKSPNEQWENEAVSGSQQFLTERDTLGFAYRLKDSSQGRRRLWLNSHRIRNSQFDIAV